MASKLKKNLIVIALLIIASFIVVNFAFAQADLGMEYGEQIGLSSEDPRVMAANVIRIALGFLGIIAVSLIIYAGWLYMTAAGEEEKIEKAKKILTGAIIGLIIILSSFAIASFVLNRLLTASTPGVGTGIDTGAGPGIGPGVGPGISDDEIISCDSMAGPDTCEADATLCPEGFYCDTGSCICRAGGGYGEFCDGDGGTTTCEADDNLCSGYLTCDTETCTCLGAPVIEWVSPADGALGNLVTIGGRYFGSATGRVYFWDGSDYIMTAAEFPGSVNANCDNNWQDNQIVVLVPSAAVSGPIRVVTADGREDTTDNDRGPNLDDFVVNDIVRPGLCKVNPGEGVMNDAIAYHGLNLSGSAAYFGGQTSNVAALEPSFGDNLGGTAKVPNIRVGKTTTFVSSMGIASNYFRFTKKAEPYAGPTITFFEPAQGAPDQYVTIYGRSFGRIRGTTNHVYFKGATQIEASYQFPEICAASVWSDNQVVVKVPAGLANGDYIISMEISGQTINSESSFKVDSSLALAPSLCKIDPTMGPNNSPISLWGENFGQQATGLVRFYSNKNQNNISFWGDEGDAQKIVTTVHQEAQTGPVQVVQSALFGNGLNFRVGSCAKNEDCGSGKVCCPADSSESGQCKDNPDQCYILVASSVYEWEFSTGAGEPVVPPTYYSCLGRSYVTGNCDPLPCPNSAGVCSPYNNIAAGESFCECCCEIGQDARDCCPPLVCRGACGSDTSNDNVGLGHCSGCASAGTTQAEHDAACNCFGHSGKICDTSVAGGVCRDCEQLSSAEECSKHTTCCVDAVNGNICRGGMGKTGMVNYNNLAYCQYYQCADGGGVCDSSPVASSTRSVFETREECAIGCSQISRPGEKCVATTTPTQTTCNPGFNCGPGYSCLDDLDQEICPTCCCDPSVPQVNANGLICAPDREPCTGYNRGLYCGCEQDEDCGFPDTVGCASDTCCRSRPEVSGVYPAEGATGVCLNTSISASFSQKMNINSFVGNVIVAGDYGNSVCPAGTQYLALKHETIKQKNTAVNFYQNVLAVVKRLSGSWLGGRALADTPDPNHNYCAITGITNGVQKADGTTDLTFNLNKPLDINRTYYVIIKGDENLNSGQGVFSDWGIGMNGPDTAALGGQTFSRAKIWSFTTGAAAGRDDCKLSSVTVSPASYLFRKAGQIQSFQARPRSTDGQILVAIPGYYDWEWSWVSSKPEVATVNNSDDSIQPVTAKDVKDGKSYINATATITKDTIFDTEGQAKTGQAEVYVFLCENPWPPFKTDGSWEPWKDSLQGADCLSGTGDCVNTNYEFYYCRDRGAAGPADDLPAILSENTIIRGRSSAQDILKEAYFFREETPDVSEVNLTVASIPSEGRKVILSWTPISVPPDEVLADYRVYYGTSSGRYSVNIGAGSTTYYEVDNLNNNQTYYFSIVAEYISGAVSGYSNEVSATPEDTVGPVVPTMALEPGDRKVTVSWTDNSGGEAVSFRIYYKATDTCNDSVSFGDSRVPIKNPETFNLTNEVAYCFGLAAYDAEGNRSDMVTGSVTPVAPTP
ncbi:MAG: Ig-like domain-containing protein [Patescibacteria group bacterium]|nr:Ig-like domain-containing protein [Patescibacteria group bacterium]